MIRRLRVWWVGCTICATRREHRQFERRADRLLAEWAQK